MGRGSLTNEIMKWAGTVGMLANKAQMRLRCEKWVNEALSKRLMKKWADTARVSVHKPMG